MANLRVILYDNTQHNLTKELGLSKLWSLGAKAGKFDHVIPATGTTQAVNNLKKYLLGALPEQKVDLQLWGHGNVARYYIDSSVFEFDELIPIKDRLASVWIRACSSFQGEDGQEFAVELTEKLDCSVVGHTRIISSPIPAYQSGCYGLHPKQQPNWSTSDTGSSWPWVANTCLTTRMEIPEWAFLH